MQTPLLADLLSSDKDRRTQVLELLAAAGEPAVAGLVKAYANSANQSVKLSVFDAMKRIGPGALDPFLARLATIERNAQLVCRRRPDRAAPWRETVSRGRRAPPPPLSGAYST